ncbi:MAG: LD-carboxypeptidase, partial [Chitinophagaceae bacterium]|nr:LD-carboxypeptidase [Chitinophagaceae bacterium]
IIGICCPSGHISLEEIQPAVNKMKEWGFEIKTGSTIGAKDFTFAGTDLQRIFDIQNMLDDPALGAIMFGRGGYGAVRIIDKLDFKKFITRPKWIIGFSDATVFHLHLNKNFGIASVHSKMCNSFPDDWTKAEPSQIESIESIRKCIVGDKMKYAAVANEKNRVGMAEGILIGGNLSILQNMASTASDINTDGKILFIEEVEEYLYSIDRMLWNLKRSGKLNNLKAFIIGGFNKIKTDDPGEEFGRTVYDMVTEVVKEFAYPVCFDFPVGHQKNNFALKCGIKHRLTVSKEGVILEEV